jgi:hypothetical protein
MAYISFQQTPLRQLSHDTESAVHAIDGSHMIDDEARAKCATYEAKLIEVRQINPLWMITVALAVMFGLGTLPTFG